MINECPKHVGENLTTVGCMKCFQENYSQTALEAINRSFGVEQTMKCPVCGNAYKWFANNKGDQSACPPCVRAAERNI